MQLKELRVSDETAQRQGSFLAGSIFALVIGPRVLLYALFSTATTAQHVSSSPKCLFDKPLENELRSPFVAQTARINTIVKRSGNSKRSS